MYRKIILIGLLIALGAGTTLSPAWAQFTDYNDHDPGVSSASIPSWIKNTAGWWAADSITETEFLRAIEYLIENKIIKITTTMIEDIPDITTTYTLPATRQAEFIQFTGGFEDKHTGPLTLTIILPDKSEQTITTISRDGTFSATMELTSDSKIGRYTVYAEIKGEQLLVSAFNVKDRNANKAPIWIKNNAQWWSENKITDSDFVKGIGYLVENRILVVETEPSQAKAIPTGPGLTQDSCSGHARCFSGKVTKVTDGDTIRINEHSIRFALSSAPELGQTNGERAREFIDTICPVGSEALVDEDDGQTEGSYGRILAVIYCNGMNLNEELLDANLGYLPTEFCSQSEFASTSWAQKHGCTSSSEQKTSPPAEIKENCDYSYPDVCVPSPPPDLDCGEISYRNFTVLEPDPHRFDGDKDGIGCES